MQTLLVVLVFLAASVICEGDVNHNKKRIALIVDGENAKASEFPWIINMVLNDGWNSHLCGGIILDPNWILTAAHCVSGFVNNLNDIALIAGDHNQSLQESTEQKRLASKAVLHPSYSNHTKDYDYALLKVAQPFQFSDSVSSASLPASSSDVANGVLTVAGWGLTTTGWGGDSPNILQKVDLTIIPRTTCAEKYRGQVTITDKMICAAEGMKTPCNGDSGSGFVKRSGNSTNTHVVYGVVSFGKNGCDGGEEWPTVFASVPSVIPWIKNTMEGLDGHSAENSNKIYFSLLVWCFTIIKIFNY